MEVIRMAGRPSTKATNTTNQKVETKVITNETVVTVTPDLEKENAELKDQLNKLMEMMNALQLNQTAQNSVEKVETTKEVVTENNLINETDMNKRIIVTSLTTGGLNLRTAMDGSARIFRLERLGQSMPIVYSDLLQCINLQREFFEEGLVYISDSNVVSENYLEDSYKKFLTIDKINHIMDFDTETIKSLVSNTTKSLQETIVLLIAEKINKGQFVDMNKVDVIGKACTEPIDIRDIANKLR
jgi:hypothetical protein